MNIEIKLFLVLLLVLEGDKYTRTGRTLRGTARVYKQELLFFVQVGENDVAYTVIDCSF